MESRKFENRGTEERAEYNVKIRDLGKHQVTIVCSFIQPTIGTGHRSGCYKINVNETFLLVKGLW